MEQPAGNDHLLVVAEDLERMAVQFRRRRLLLLFEAVALLTADDEIGKAHLDAVLGPEHNQILVFSSIEGIDNGDLVAKKPVGIFGAQIEQAGERALIGLQAERLTTSLFEVGTTAMFP